MNVHVIISYDIKSFNFLITWKHIVIAMNFSWYNKIDIIRIFPSETIRFRDIKWTDWPITVLKKGSFIKMIGMEHNDQCEII